MKKLSIFTSLVLLSSSFNSAMASNDEITKSITIYGNSPSTWQYRPLYNGGNIEGNAIVTKSKLYEFNEGMNRITVSDLPVKIDPSSVVVKNLSVGKSIVQQEFKSSVFNLGLVLEETIGEEIEVEQVAGDRTIYHRGTLVSTSPNLVIMEDDRLRILNGYSSMIIADREVGNNTNTIIWDITSESASDDIIEYSYKTDGVSWSAEYDLYVNESNSGFSAKLESWANIYNNTNLSAKGTELKLVAGQVNQVAPQNYGMLRGASLTKDMAMEAAGGAPSFSEESFSGYHMYRLSRKADIEPFSSKKLKIYEDKERVFLNRRYEFDTNSGDKVNTIFKIMNDKESNLALPLPAGKFTVYEKDSTGNFEKSGEAMVSHTPENAEMNIEIGKAFDVTAERKRTNDRRDNPRRYGSYNMEVEIKNAKTEAVEVFVKERVYNQNWKISDASHTYRKIDSNQVEFPVKVPAKGRMTLKYKVEYSW